MACLFKSCLLFIVLGVSVTYCAGPWGKTTGCILPTGDLGWEVVGDKCLHIDYRKVGTESYANQYCQSMFGGQLAAADSDKVKEHIKNAVYRRKKVDFEGGSSTLSNLEVWVASAKGSTQCSYYDGEKFTEGECTDDTEYHFFCEVGRDSSYKTQAKTAVSTNKKGCDLPVWDEDWTATKKKCYKMTPAMTHDEGEKYCRLMFNASLADGTLDAPKNLTQRFTPGEDHGAWISHTGVTSKTKDDSEDYYEGYEKCPLMNKYTKKIVVYACVEEEPALCEVERRESS